MFGANNNSDNKERNLHLILICQESGIFDGFKIIKECLGSGHEVFLSLIYAIPENYVNPLFEKEITILEKRYSHTLYTRTVKVKPGEYGYIQEYVEAIINSNTNSKMQFLVFGNYAFIDYVSGVLGYLNIHALSIKYNILNQ